MTSLDSNRYTLRVYASDLHRDILYKTITITAVTTAVEALQLLLKKYAVDPDDRDHNRFNLAEVSLACIATMSVYSYYLVNLHITAKCMLFNSTLESYVMLTVYSYCVNISMHMAVLSSLTMDYNI